MARSDRLLSRDFALITLACGAFFLFFGATIPVLPRYVSDELGRSDAVVGVVAGSFAVSAIVLRPFIGRVGDRRGRRVLILAGSALAALGFAGHAVVDSVVPLVGMRLVVGAGQAAFFVGAATLVADLAPPSRRGEAASYFSIALYLGLGLGPFIGERVLAAWGYDAVWYLSAVGGLVALLIALPLPRGVASSGAGVAGSRGPRSWFHPAGIGPGAVLALGIMGFIGFNTFVPLYGEEIGLADVATVFLLYSAVVILIRGFGAQLPDRLGPAVTGTVALVASAVGLGLVAVTASAGGLYVGTAVLAVGSSLLYPALMAAAVNAVSDDERSTVVATFTMFFEIASAMGGVILGVVAATSSYDGAFLAGALFALAGLVLLHVRLLPRLRAAAVPVGSGHV